MNGETITSRQNPLMTHLRKLASSRSYRKKSGEYLCDGTKLLDEALKWGAPVQTAVFSDGVDIPALPDTVRAVRVSGDLMRSVSPMETPQGALFTVALPETKLPETLAGKHYLVLDGVQDPGNVGTILRTAAAANAGAVLLSEGSVDVYNDKTIRSAMGAIFKVPVVQDVTDEQLDQFCADEDRQVYGTAPEGTVSYVDADYSQPVILAFGNEGNGLPGPFLDCCDDVLTIPMRPDTESLNLSMSVGIVLYKAWEKNGFKE